LNYAIIYLDKHLNDIGGGDMGIGDTFKALSDPTRREILNLLKRRSLTAGEISDKFNMTPATISHHLSVLKGAGLVTDEKKGKYIHYELSMTMIEELLGWATGLQGGSKDGKSE